MRRITTADYLVAIDDPRGGGSIVERQWAKQLGMPVFSVRLHEAVRPHDDGDGWNVTIAADLSSPDRTVAELMAQIMNWRAVIKDYAARRRAYELKNQSALAHLQGAWQAFTRDQQDRATLRARVAVERINAYLASGVAWELASERERRSISIALLAPPQPRGAVYELRSEQLRCIASAAVELELNYLQTLEATVLIARRMALLPRTRFTIRSVQQARSAIQEALNV